MVPITERCGTPNKTVTLPTRPSIPPGSLNEYQLRLGLRQRQVWFTPLADEHTSEALTGMARVLKGSQFYLHTLRSSANGINHTVSG